MTLNEVPRTTNNDIYNEFVRAVSKASSSEGDWGGSHDGFAVVVGRREGHKDGGIGGEVLVEGTDCMDSPLEDENVELMEPRMRSCESRDSRLRPHRSRE
jgi:hypothetical protein